MRSTARKYLIIASGFFVLHAALHYLYSEHDAYEFDTLVSLVLIYGAAACGLVYFLFAWRKQ